MLSESDRIYTDAFIEVARSRRLLSDEESRKLVELTHRRGLRPALLAAEIEILSPVEIEIVEAFMSPQDLAPGYELLDVVGHGALGVVYRARQPHLHRDVAIKAILQSRLTQQNVLARFQQEGALIGRLQHPNIVSAYDFGSHRDRLYLVMEYVPGTDLRQRLQQGAMPVSTALSILRQTAAGLAHAFSHRIIHRDIKPGNLLLADAPAGYDLAQGAPLVKIADFGLARFHSSPEIDQQNTRLTMTGATLGTPMYCAPEQLSGDEVDHRADIYALGATFFQALTGEVPFASDRVSKIIAAKVTGQPPRMELLPESIDPDIKQLLLDMMQTDPEDRIQDYHTLIQRVDAITGASSGSTGRSPASQVRSDSASKSATSWIADPEAAGRSNAGALARWLLVAGAVMVVAGGLSLPHILSRTPAPTMVHAGWEDHLFDGKTMAGWLVRGGLWSSGVDNEGGAILIGRGSAVRALPLPRALPVSEQSGLGVRVGIDLQDAESAELHFAFGGDDIENASRYVVRHSSQEVALGTKANATSEFVSIGSVAKKSSVALDQPVYHEVRVERHGSNWFAYFDEYGLGTLPATEHESDRWIQLTADGTVHFEGPLVYQLGPP